MNEASERVLADVRVAIVGAGLSGLVAARHLDAKGISFVVLEARDRVGGRTLSHTTKFGTRVDLGAQWIGPSQDRVLKLVDDLGLSSFPQWTEGKKLLSLGNSVKTYESSLPSLSVISSVDLGVAILRLESLLKEIPLENPLAAPRAAEWDAMTVQAWKRRNVKTRGAQAMIDAVVRTFFAVEPSELSFLFFLYRLRHGGGLVRWSEIKKPAREHRLVE